MSTTSSRPRGWADWNPNAESLALIENVQQVLLEYSAQLPMTARQIFYRLVGAHGYAKTERAYKNLCEKLVRARRAELISFGDIRDDGTTALGGDWGFDDPADFWEWLRDRGQQYRRPVREGQGYRIEVWCEAAGMAPQLQRVATPYGASVYSTGGFSSVTVTYEIAARVEEYEEPTVFLHVGDFDPSGESIFTSMTDDVLGFVGDTALFLPERIALTAEQVERWDLPTAPPKASDSRSRNWVGETTQAEALPPDQLAQIVEDAVLRYTDTVQMRNVEEETADERRRIEERLREVDF